MRGAILPFTNTPSWHGAQFKKSAVTTLRLPLLYINLKLNFITFLKSDIVQ